MSDMVTIAMVADHAGVSIPTVSKVLNHRNGVSKATRQAVESAIKETGYVHRQRNGHRGVGIIDLLISGIDSQWAYALVQGVNAEAQRAELEVIITGNFSESTVQNAWLDRVLRRGSDGVILVVSQMLEEAIQELKSQDLPIVLIDPIGAGDPSFFSVSATNWAGGLEATEHLISLGHTRIGLITGPEEEACSMDRLDGYSAALRRAGIQLDQELVRHGNSLFSGGRTHGGALLDLPNPPTAIFSCSDEQAYGVYIAARDRGLKVPKQVSVVGFDDVNLCQWVSPQLTTIRQPLNEMGAAAVRYIVAPTKEKRLELATSLIIRKSTSKPFQNFAPPTGLEPVTL